MQNRVLWQAGRQENKIQVKLKLIVNQNMLCLAKVQHFSASLMHFYCFLPVKTVARLSEILGILMILPQSLLFNATH